jgi:beta-lactamase class A
MHHDSTLVHDDAALTRDEFTHDLVLDSGTPTDDRLQRELESIDARLRERFGMAESDTACGVVDLVGERVALVRPDRVEHAAGVAKLGVLLAYFALRPDAARRLPADDRRDLGLMAKADADGAADRFVRELGAHAIRRGLNDFGFDDLAAGGATVRQVLRFWLLLDQGKLVSPAASRQMRECFAAPEVPHDDVKFVQGLRERTNVRMLRKWGSREHRLHDSAIVTGPGRRYAIAALTHHANGDAYLVELARAVDDVMSRGIIADHDERARR